MDGDVKETKKKKKKKKKKKSIIIHSPQIKSNLIQFISIHTHLRLINLSSSIHSSFILLLALLRSGRIYQNTPPIPPPLILIPLLIPSLFHPYSSPLRLGLGFRQSLLFKTLPMTATAISSSSASTNPSRLISDLCVVVAALITPARVPSTSRLQVQGPVTPGAIAALLLGVSFAMMVCGSVTFVLGFMLIPWIIGFLMLLCFAGAVSYLGLIWRGVFKAGQNQLPGQFLSKLPIL